MSVCWERVDLKDLPTENKILIKILNQHSIEAAL